MKSVNWLVVFMLCLLPLSLAMAESATGMWTTVDDETGKKSAVVQLFETNGLLNGRIVKVFSQSGDTGVCSKCTDEFKDKPIINLQFIWGLKDKGAGIWEDGRILDARSGKIYRVNITVKEDKLYVRGYLGFALLGRTQVWLRA